MLLAHRSPHIAAHSALNYYNYFSEIEETFIRRRGRNLLLSPLDWALMETWQERGIPLHVVLRGIETIFDGMDRQAPSTRKRNVKSLLYCKEEIEAQYAEWLERQVGKNGAKSSAGMQNSDPAGEEDDSAGEELFSGEMIENHLEKVAAALNKAMQSAVSVEWREILEKVAGDLKKLKQNPPAAKDLEEELEKLESLTDENLLKFFDGGKFKKDIEKEIAAYKVKMDREVYQKTFDLLLLKRLREEAEIPRLTLFYL